MFDAFIWSVFLALILLGTVAICYIIMLKLLLSDCKDDYYILLPCNKNSRKVREKAYSLRIKLNLLGEEIHGKVLVVDNGMSREEKESLLGICEDYNDIYYIEKDNIREFFDGRI